MSRKNVLGNQLLNGFLGVGTSCTGDLAFEDSLRIDGTFKGSIRSANTLTICTRPGVRICFCDTFRCNRGCKKFPIPCL